MSEPFFDGPLAVLVRRLVAHSPPDPWSPEIDAAVRAHDAVPLCPECLHPQEPAPRFCPHCQYPTGDFVPLMPLEQVYCVGEVLRRGVRGPGRNNLSQNVGFFLITICQYSILGVAYVFWLVAKAVGSPLDETRRRPLAVAEQPDDEQT